MKKFLLILALGGFLIGLFGLWYYQTDRVITRKVTKLAAMASIEQSEGMPVRSFRSQRFAELIAETITMSSSISELDHTFSREELTRNFGGYLAYVEEATVEADSIQIEQLGTALARARLNLTARITLRGASPRLYLLNGHLDFIKEGSSWLLKDALLQETAATEGL